MSRRRRAGIMALCLLAALVLIALDRGLLSNLEPAEPKSREQQSANDLAKYHRRTFTVVNIVDGDTIDIDVPDGQYKHTRIRLWGIDTPETKNPQVGQMYFGPEAAEFAGQVTLGKEVRVYLDEGNRTRGKYGRLLAYVELPDGEFLNELLLEKGYAYADSRFRHSFYTKYKQLEAVGKAQQKGLWLNVTREQLPEWLRNRAPTLLAE